MQMMEVAPRGFSHGNPSYQHERPEGPSVSKVRNQARPRGSQVVTASWSPQDSGPHAHHPRDVLSHFILNSCPCLAKFTTQTSSPYISFFFFFNFENDTCLLLKIWKLYLTAYVFLNFTNSYSSSLIWDHHYIFFFPNILRIFLY